MRSRTLFAASGLRGPRHVLVHSRCMVAFLSFTEFMCGRVVLWLCLSLGAQCACLCLLGFFAFTASSPILFQRARSCVSVKPRSAMEIKENNDEETIQFNAWDAFQQRRHVDADDVQASGNHAVGSWGRSASGIARVLWWSDVVAGGQVGGRAGRHRHVRQRCSDHEIAGNGEDSAVQSAVGIEQFTSRAL